MDQGYPDKGVGEQGQEKSHKPVQMEAEAETEKEKWIHEIPHLEI